jgi:hypothetical protein
LIASDDGVAGLLWLGILDWGMAMGSSSLLWLDAPRVSC